MVAIGAARWRWRRIPHHFHHVPPLPLFIGVSLPILFFFFYFFYFFFFFFFFFGCSYFGVGIFHLGSVCQWPSQRCHVPSPSLRRGETGGQVSTCPSARPNLHNFAYLHKFKPVACVIHSCSIVSISASLNGLLIERRRRVDYFLVFSAALLNDHRWI